MHRHQMCEIEFLEFGHHVCQIVAWRWRQMEAPWPCYAPVSRGYARPTVDQRGYGAASGIPPGKCSPTPGHEQLGTQAIEMGFALSWRYRGEFCDQYARARADQ